MLVEVYVLVLLNDVLRGFLNDVLLACIGFSLCVERLVPLKKLSFSVGIGDCFGPVLPARSPTVFLFKVALNTVNTTLKCIYVDREDCVDKKAAF